MRFWKGEDTEYRVRWYRANEDAKIITVPSQFRSHSTWKNGEPVHPLGEQLPASDTTYDRGRNSGNFRGQHYEGSPEAWRMGGTRGIDPEILTDEFGGTEECPYEPAPGPVVVATTRKGRGSVVAVGSPSLFTIPVDNGSPSIGWNEEFWAAVHEWADSVGEDRAIGSPGEFSRWRIPQLWPEYSGVGGEDIDYSTEEAKAELETTLGSLSVIVCGYTGYDFASDRQLFNPDVLPQILQWVNDGGILVVVNNTLPFDLSPEPLAANEILESMNVDLRFEHGDGGYGVHRDWRSGIRAVSQGPTSGYRAWTNPLNLKLADQPASVTFNAVPQIAQLLELHFNAQTFTDEVPRTVAVRFYAWSTNAAVPIKIRFLLLDGDGFFDHEFTVPIPTTPTLYTLAWGQLTGSYGSVTSKSTSLLWQPQSASSTPVTLFVQGFNLEEGYCIGGECGSRGLMVNSGHPILNQPAAIGVCGIQAQQFSTVLGGDWAVCEYQGNAITVCRDSGLRLGGSSAFGSTLAPPPAVPLVLGGSGSFGFSPAGSGLVLGGSGSFGSTLGSSGGGSFTGSGGLVLAGSGSFGSTLAGPGGGSFAGSGGLVLGGSGSFVGP